MGNRLTIDVVTLWTPTEISTVAWYDAADMSTIGFGSQGVNLWEDKGGNGYHATQNTNSDWQPTYTESDPLANNKPSLSSPNVTKHGLETPSFTSKRVYAVCYYGDGTTATFLDYSYLLGNILEEITNFRDFRINGNSGNPTWWTSNDWDETPRVNGGSETNTALPMPLTILEFDHGSDITQETFIGGSNYWTNRVWRGAYCEFIFTDGTEDLETRQKIEGYLAWKWGLQSKLPSDHPYKNRAPTA